MGGLSKSKITKFFISPDGDVEIRVSMPAGIIEGPYEVEGQVLKLKIKGKGIVKTTLSE